MDDLPALLGGAPVRPGGPPDWPGADAAVAEALQAAVADGSWGKYAGRHGEVLSERLASLTGQRFALTCGSGTYAIELALRCVPVRPGDEVVLAAYDYPGNFLSAHAVGALPVLVDVVPGNWQLDPARLDEAITPATRAVVVSHLHGGSVPMREVMAACARRGVAVIEDAAQSPGATVQGRPAGGWGDLAVWSFGGSKLLTAGRGGALLTSRPEFHQRARLILGRGNNLVAPLSELQAAALLPQLDALAERHVRRLRAVERIGEALPPGLRLLERGGAASPGYYKVGLRYDAETFGLLRKVLVAASRAEGVALDEGFRALHAGRSPGRYRAAGPLDEAARAGQGMLVLHHPVLLEGANEVATALAKLHRHAAALASLQ